MILIGTTNNVDNNHSDNSVVMNTLSGRFAARQDQGERANQEDDYGMMDGRAPETGGFEHTLLVLTDGMGGHSGGEVASSLVTEAIIKAYQTDSGPVADQLRASVEVANNRLGEVVAANADKQGMGCTAVATVITRRGVEWISIGDSPMWMFSDGVLRRLNADHSMAPILASLVETGRMDAEEAATDPKRHALRSAVTGNDIDLIDQSSQPVAIGNKDLLILASDGLQTLSEDELILLLKHHADQALQTLANHMIAAVKEKGKPDQDNVTILLYRPDGDYGIAPTSTMSGKLHDKQEAKSNIASNPASIGKRVYTRYVALGVVALIVVFVVAYWGNWSKQVDEETPSEHTNQATEGEELPASVPIVPIVPEPTQQESGQGSPPESMNNTVTDVAPTSSKTTDLKSE